VSQPAPADLSSPVAVHTVLAAPTQPLPQLNRRIPEIDGLRGVAIALIVIYHVWMNRVSGGVDAFFLLSGFLITMSLVRSASRGRIRLGAYYSRIARRITPPALLVLVGVVILTLWWLPQSRWRGTLGDVTATALYVVNWHLAENSVDYLASRLAASPVQHYWSLAVQAQFYLVWPLLIGAATWVASRLGVSRRRAVAIVLGIVFASSLTYSVYRTAVNQTYTYFDTVARLWEFALGGLVVLALPYLRPGRRLAVVLGWAGLAGLAVCGLVFRGGNEFPGWAALWPTLAASLLIVTAGTGNPYGADRLLRSGPLRWLGGLSYALYLWHWPLLICYLTVTGSTTASLRGGVLLILGSLVLAMATKWLAEDRLQASGIGQRTVRGGFVLAASAVVVALITTAAWGAYIERLAQQQDRMDEAAFVPTVPVPPGGGPPPPGLVLGPYPGALHAAYGGDLPDLPYRPGPLNVREDHPGELYPGCHQNQEDSEPIICEIGPGGTGPTIAVVGGSRAQHWLPTLEVLAKQHGWRILAITKSGCLFTFAEQYESCMEWNRRVFAELLRLRPDAVFTTGTRVSRDGENLPTGYLERWRALDAAGIPVLAVRDVPRPLVDVPDCVELHGPMSPECGSPASQFGLDDPPPLTGRTDVPDNVTLIDLTPLLCPDGYCAPVIGNVLVYHDNSHLTATYARTLAPFLGAAILEATGWEPRPSSSAPATPLPGP